MTNISLNLNIQIIIVNYRTADLVIQCLETIFSQKDGFENGKIIVVDNNSQDDSYTKICAFVDKQNWQSRIDVLDMPKNGGFAYGCNAGIRHIYAKNSTAHYIMLLNPDTLVREGAISELVDFMELNLKVGIAGSQIENQDGGIEVSAHQFHSPIGELLDGANLGGLTKLFPSYDVNPPLQYQPHQCDWVSGSSMIIRKQVIDDIGLLDEAFFLYFEEVDFFFRSAKAGWQTWYVPAAKVMHIEGASTGIKENKRRPQYWYDSRRRFTIKHHGLIGLIVSDILWGMGRLTYATRRFFRVGAQQPSLDPKWYALDLLWGDFKAILTGKVFKLEKEKIRF
jgi:N-acetylglucosaminyl-diphospho-decaprenol L-rhamnosyltransferase